MVYARPASVSLSVFALYRCRMPPASWTPRALLWRGFAPMAKEAVDHSPVSSECQPQILNCSLSANSSLRPLRTVGPMAVIVHVAFPALTGPVILLIATSLCQSEKAHSLLYLLRPESHAWTDSWRKEERPVLLGAIQLIGDSTVRLLALISNLGGNDAVFPHLDLRRRLYW